MSIFTASIGLNSQSDNMWFTIKYIVVATLFLCALWLLSRWLVQKKGTVQQGFVKVHHTTTFANGKYLSVVEVDGIYYVIGTDKSTITLIDKRDHIEIPKAHGTQSNVDFKALLKGFTKKHEENEDVNNVDQD